MKNDKTIKAKPFIIYHLTFSIYLLRSIDDLHPAAAGSILANRVGGIAKRPKATDCKSVIRGFESHCRLRMREKSYPVSGLDVKTNRARIRP